MTLSPPIAARFMSPEHESFGPNLPNSQSDPDHPTFNQVKSNQVLKLPNGIQLTFGQIVALAGDFYGVPEEPIIDHKHLIPDTMIWRKKRFRAFYDTLACAEYSKIKKESTQLISIMQEEKLKIKEAIKNGGSMSEKDSNYFNKKYD